MSRYLARAYRPLNCFHLLNKNECKTIDSQKNLEKETSIDFVVSIVHANCLVSVSKDTAIQWSISTTVHTGVKFHYNDVIMGAIASQITSLTIVYSNDYSDADQRKNQIPASLAVVRGIHRGPGYSPHKWPVTRKMFPFDDVIMLTHCGPVMSCGSIELVQYWNRKWLVAWQCLGLLLCIQISSGGVDCYYCIYCT